MSSDEKAVLITRLEAMLKAKDVINIEENMQTLAMGLLLLLREDGERAHMARGLLARIMERWGGR